MMFLVGNQVDNESQWEVTREDAGQYAKENLMAHYGETSAKTGHNVDKAFWMIVDQILIKIDNKMLDVELEDGIWRWP